MKEALAGYLETRLSQAGIDEVEIAVLPTAAKMAEALAGGRVDLYVESLLVAAKVGRQSGAVAAFAPVQAQLAVLERDAEVSLVNN